MAAPNLITAATATPGCKVFAVTASLADLFAAVTSSHAIYIHSILVSNITSGALAFTCNHVVSATNYSLCTSLSVPANSQIDILNGRGMWLIDGESIQVVAPATSNFVCNAPYVDFS